MAIQQTTSHSAKKRGRAVILALLFIAVPLKANQPIELPSLGDGASRLVSPQMEQQIGEVFLKQLNAALPTTEDPLIQYWAERHLRSLTEHSDLQQAVRAIAVIKNPEMNAFAAPGGIIGLNLGLILRAQDSDEYSSVMAHEIAHLSQRHFARGIEAQQASSIPNLIGLFAALLVGAAGGTDAGLAALTTVQALGQSQQLRFSREREQEADRIGMNILVRAGMDPHAVSRMFERMQRAYRFSNRPPEFLLTHPLSESRITDARNQARRHKTPPSTPANQQREQDYRLIRIRAEAEISQNAQFEIKKYRRAYDDSPGNVMLGYALGLSLARVEDYAGSHAQARGLAQRLYQRYPDRVLYLAAYADVLAKTGQIKQSIDLLQSSLTRLPDNYPLSMLLAGALTADGRAIEAESVLTKQSKLRPLDVYVWYELAETAGLAGNVTAVHLARAEYFYLNGAFHRAIQHLQYAKRLVAKGNQQLAMKLGQRIQDLRTEIRKAAT